MRKNPTCLWLLLTTLGKMKYFSLNFLNSLTHVTNYWTYILSVFYKIRWLFRAHIIVFLEIIYIVMGSARLMFALLVFIAMVKFHIIDMIEHLN